MGVPVIFPYMKEATYGTESISLERNTLEKIRLSTENTRVPNIGKVKHVFFPMQLSWAGQIISDNMFSFTETLQVNLVGGADR